MTCALMCQVRSTTPAFTGIQLDTANYCPCDGCFGDTAHVVGMRDTANLGSGGTDAENLEERKQWWEGRSGYSPGLTQP